MQYNIINYRNGLKIFCTDKTPTDIYEMQHNIYIHWPNPAYDLFL